MSLVPEYIETAPETVQNFNSLELGALFRETPLPQPVAIGDTYIHIPGFKIFEYTSDASTLAFNGGTYLIGDEAVTVQRLSRALTIEEYCRLHKISVPSTKEERVNILNTINRERGLASKLIGATFPHGHIKDSVNLNNIPEGKRIQFIPPSDSIYQEDPRIGYTPQEFIVACVDYSGFINTIAGERHLVGICIGTAPYSDKGLESNNIRLVRVAGGIDPHTKEFIGSYKNPTVPEFDPIEGKWLMMARGMLPGDELVIKLLQSENENITSQYRVRGELRGLTELLNNIKDSKGNTQDILRVAISSGQALPISMEQMFTKEQLYLLSANYPYIYSLLKPNQMEFRLIHYVTKEPMSDSNGEIVLVDGNPKFTETYHSGGLVTSKNSSDSILNSLCAEFLIPDIITQQHYPSHIKRLQEDYKVRTNSPTLLPDKKEITGAVASIQEIKDTVSQGRVGLISAAYADLGQIHYLIDLNQLNMHIGHNLLIKIFRQIENLQRAA